MTKWNVTRRGFLKASAAVACVPAVVPAGVLGANAPSNRLNMGCIGLGGQGTGNMNDFLGKKDCRVVAVCDVEDHSTNYGSYLKGRDLGRLPAKAAVEKRYGGNYKCDAYNDFRELLAREDIDVVSIATPDHWHVPISIAAAGAGKDIYCEKPLTLTIGEGRLLADAVRKFNRILQTGSQQRSMEEFRFGCELVRNGRIGKLQTVHVGIPGNNVDNPLDWKPEPIPPGFDYDMWLGPARMEPYTTMRCHYTFRFLLDYSGGQMTNWGAHYFDIAQWGLGADDGGPVEVAGTGEFPDRGLWSTATKVDLEYTYPNGVKMYARTGGGHTRFEGTDGWVDITRGKITASADSLLNEKIGPNEVHLYNSRDHKQNFLDCVKSRKQPICTAEIGHRSATVCHLGNIAMLLGRKVTWDPMKEEFPNDWAANSFLWRKMRSPWNY